jgi:hypothetical protein
VKLPAPLLLFIAVSCSNSAEVGSIKINNEVTARHHYIPYLNSYIIIPDSFVLEKDHLMMGRIAGSASHKGTWAFLSWTTKPDHAHEYYDGLKHMLESIIQYDRHNVGYKITEERFLINGMKAKLITDDYGDEASPDRKITSRLIFEKGDSVYEFVSRTFFYGRDLKLDDSLRFALLSVIPGE